MDRRAAVISKWGDSWCLHAVDANRQLELWVKTQPDPADDRIRFGVRTTNADAYVTYYQSNEAHDAAVEQAKAWSKAIRTDPPIRDSGFEEQLVELHKMWQELRKVGPQFEIAQY